MRVRIPRELIEKGGRFVFLVSFVLVLLAGRLSGQAVGDYGSRFVGPSDWGTASNWLICQTNGTWAGATVASTFPTSSNNVWIRSGQTMNLNASTRQCFNLNVENGAQLIGSQALYVVGNFTVNGIVNTTGVLRFYGNSINGGGSVTVSTFRMYNTNKTVESTANLYITSPIEFRTSNLSIINNGSIVLDGNITVASVTGCVWTNNNASYLGISGSFVDAVTLMHLQIIILSNFLVLHHRILKFHLPLILIYQYQEVRQRLYWRIQQ